MKAKEIKTKGTQQFSVPNTPEGRIFIRLARKFRNSNVVGRMRARGRAVNRLEKGGNQSEIPLRNADWIALYMDESAHVARKSAAHWREHVRGQEAIRKLRDVEADLYNVKLYASNLERTINRLELERDAALKAVREATERARQAETLALEAENARASMQRQLAGTMPHGDGQPGAAPILALPTPQGRETLVITIEKR